MHKQTHNNTQAKQVLQKLFALFEIVDTKGLHCINALTSQMSDYEDAVMSECAYTENIDYIITRNLKDFAASKVPVLSPSDFLKLVYKNNPL